MALYTNAINLETQKPKKQTKPPENLKKTKNPTSIHNLIYKSVEKWDYSSLLERVQFHSQGCSPLHSLYTYILTGNLNLSCKTWPPIWHSTVYIRHLIKTCLKGMYLRKSTTEIKGGFGSIISLIFHHLWQLREIS